MLLRYHEDEVMIKKIFWFFNMLGSISVLIFLMLSRILFVSDEQEVQSVKIRSDEVHK